ncbi:MAG TPA: beta-phosphoglucomutase [Fimbriimonas sp.]
MIFDLDGVLVSTDEFHYLGWKQLCDEEGIPFDRTLNHRLRGVSRMESLAIILESAGKSPSDEQRKAYAERKNRTYRSLLERLDPSALLPGALEMLRKLRGAGVKTAIGSSSKNAGLIVEKVGIRDLIDAVVDGNDITESKPSPEVFLKAAQALGLRPEECLVVEDAEAGVVAGLRAEMRVLGIGESKRLPGAHRVVADLGALSLDELLGIR